MVSGDGFDELLRLARSIEAQAKLLAAAVEAQCSRSETKKTRCHTGPNAEPVLLKTWLAADRLGITADHARKLARRGCGVKVGGRWHVDIGKAGALLGSRHV